MDLSQAVARPSEVAPIVFEPMYITASINWCDDTETATLTVYRSPLVEWRDDWVAPVRRVLSSNCNRLTGAKEIEDPNMMMGSGIMFEHEMFEECPGGNVDHDCALTTLGGFNHVMRRDAYVR